MRFGKLRFNAEISKFHKIRKKGLKLLKGIKYLEFIRYFFTFFYIHNKKVLDSRKFFDFRFSMDLHVLRCPENDLTDFGKICPSVCTIPKFCGHCISRTYGRKLMKLYIQLHIYVIWSWLDFGGYRSRRSDVIRNFLFL